MKAIVTASPSAIVPSSEVARARQELRQTREQLVERLHQLEAKLPVGRGWRKAVLQRPLLTLGGAFLAGWLLARLVSRTDR